MNTFFSRGKTFFAHAMKLAKAHRLWATFIALLVVAGGFYAYRALTSTSAEMHYVLAAAERGTLVSSVSGSGAVSVSNQVDLKPKVSGNVIAIPVAEGQTVRAGTLLVQLDAQDAQKTVRDAEAGLEGAQISLKKLTQPADALAMTQAGNAVTQAEQSEKNAEDDLVKAYDDGFTTVANAFIDLPGTITGLDSILNGATVNAGQTNASAYYDIIKNSKTNADGIHDAALTSYKTARDAYNKNLQDYKNTSRYADHATIEALVLETYDTVKAMSEATKNTKTLLDTANDVLTVNGQSKVPAILTTHENSTQTYIGTTNTHLANLLNIKNSIKNSKDAITTSEQTITEKKQALAKLTDGPDPLDVQSQQLAVQQKENSLRDVHEALLNYSLVAPFDGVVAKISVKRGDAASAGTAVATIITAQKIAQVSLNEVDVAKIKVGQKATLTFDAFPDLTISGGVVQVDTIGTITQGVVNYTVQIAFDTQDDRVRPNMSVSAAIITDTKQDVLLVPNGAVKSQGGSQYVQILDGVQGAAGATSAQGIPSKTPPREQSITTGATNDSMTEITSGLQAGDLVVVRTISGATQSAQTQTSGGLRIPGLGGGGGGNFRTGTTGR